MQIASAMVNCEVRRQETQTVQYKKECGVC